MLQQTIPKFQWLTIMKVYFSSYQVQTTWGWQEPLLHAVIKDPGSIHFMAPSFCGASKSLSEPSSSAGKSRKKENVEDGVGDFIGHSWRCRTSLLLMFYWLSFSHMMNLNCKGGQEASSNSVHNTILSVSSVLSALHNVCAIVDTQKHH